MIGFVLATVWMMYLAERRRSYVMQIMVFSAVGAMAILFAFYAFRLAPFSYVFTGGGARFWFALDGASRFFLSLANEPIMAATFVALLLYVTVRRCRYFGNTAPLVMVLLSVPAGDDADGFEAVAVGAAVSVYLCWRGVRGCAGDQATQIVSRSVRWGPIDTGDALLDAAA